MNYNLICISLLIFVFNVNISASVLDIFASYTTNKDNYVLDNIYFFLSDSPFDHYIGKKLSGQNVTIVEWTFALIYDILNDI